MSDAEKMQKNVLKIQSNLQSDDELFNFESQARNLIRLGTRDLVIDFEHVSALNSKAIGKILIAYKSVKKHGGKLTVKNLNTKIRELFNRLMFDKLFQFEKEEHNKN